MYRYLVVVYLLGLHYIYRNAKELNEEASLRNKKNGINSWLCGRVILLGHVVGEEGLKWG